MICVNRSLTRETLIQWLEHISICAQTFPTSHYLIPIEHGFGLKRFGDRFKFYQLQIFLIIQLVTKLILILRRRRNSSIIIPNWGGLRLKAILASEWSQLKKKYKEIQKQNMRKLKQSLKVTQQRHLVVHSSFLGFHFSICWCCPSKTY